MKKEQFMQALLIRFPSEVLEEPGMSYLAREIKTGERRLDIALKDRRDRHVLVEVQAGALDTQHIDRHIDFVEGYLEKYPQADIRVLFVASHIDVHKKSFLQKRGYEFREISESRFKEIGALHGFQGEEKSSMTDRKIITSGQAVKRIESQSGMIANPDADELVDKLKSTEGYKKLKAHLFKKIENESEAKRIIENNIGSIKRENLQIIFDLVDEAYADTSGPWFARLIKRNGKDMLEESDKRINDWFTILTDKQLSVQDRIDTLRKGQSHISGASVGLVTLMLYLLDKTKYSIWFEAQHRGLQILYPHIGKFSSKGSQYPEFNDTAKRFAKQYQFNDTEMDWVLRGLPKFL